MGLIAGSKFRRVIALGTGAVLLACLSLLLFRGAFLTDPVSGRVTALVANQRLRAYQLDSTHFIQNQLIALGPSANPQMRRILPARTSKNELHRRLAGIVYELGPAVSRAMVSAVEEGLDENYPIETQNLLRSLYWSIPESSKAVATLSNWLAQPSPGRMLFGMRDAREIWPHVPQLASLLIEWLKLPDQAREAAEGLGCMGTNALAAIPHLIDVYQQGVAGHPPNLKLATSYAPNIDPILLNQVAAVSAFGQIGIATPEVLATLLQAKPCSFLIETD